MSTELTAAPIFFPPVVDKRTVLAALAVSNPTVRRLVEDGELIEVRFGRGVVRYLQSSPALVRLMDAGRR